MLLAHLDNDDDVCKNNRNDVIKKCNKTSIQKKKKIFNQVNNNDHSTQNEINSLNNS